VMEFTTMYPLPFSPLTVYPRSGYISKTDSVKIGWNSSSPHISDYQIEVSYDSLMNDCFITDVTTDTAYVIRGLSDNEKVFWRVRARNKSGESKYSSTEVFATVFPPPLKYSLSSFNFFRGTWYISYCIEKQSDVLIALYNLKGKIVMQSRTVNVMPGYYTKNLSARHLSPGSYILKIKAGDFMKSAGAVLVE
jgi:hypothetical protein